MPLLSRREFLKLAGLAPAALLLPWAGIHAASNPVPFRVNGQPVEFYFRRKLSLMEFLREGLGLRGTKYGCGKGVCGSCTVLVNGRALRSCMINPAHLQGLEVTTIEGLGGAGSLDPIQKSFADLCVFQCGYCAPGFVLAAKALLEENPRPDSKQIRQAFYGNLCRCTGYQPIVQAVRATYDSDFRAHLMKRPRISLPGGDALAYSKVDGTLMYAQDHSVAGQLHAKVVWSEMPHAWIEDIDPAEALGIPGVVKVLTHRDLPGKTTFGSIFTDQPVLASDKVRFLGDAVALVVATDAQTAAKAVARVVVKYQPLPGLFDPEDSLDQNAPRLFDTGNLCHRSVTRKGDVAQGRALAKEVVKGIYRTPMVDPGFLEPEACLTYVDEQGVLVVASASQAPHSYRDQIAEICALPRGKVQMKTLAAGGAFGARGDMSVQHLCALATVATGRPVRLSLSREESMQVHAKRHPFTLHYETGADAQGRLTHCLVRGIADAGAYHSASMAVMENAAAFATGPYQIDHCDVEIKAAFTNNPTCGAMRGFGAAQVCLAMERQIDKLARQLKIDPLEMRMINALEPGKVSQWGQVMGDEVGIKTCLETLATEAAELRQQVPNRAGQKIGLGFACGYKNTSSPTFMPLGSADITMVLNHLGIMEIYSGGCEIGQGLVTALAQIAAQRLTVPLERLKVISGSTRRTDSPMLTSGSQQIFLSGKALWQAAGRFETLLKDTAARLCQRKAEELILAANGMALHTDEIIISYEQLAWKSKLIGQKLEVHHKYTPPVKNIELPTKVEKIGSEQRILPSLGYTAQAALVAVDVETAEVEVLKIIAAQDVGKAINLQGIEGQVRGGVVMGLGWCLKENLELVKGKVINDNLDRYFIPRTVDTPEIKVLIVEVPDPFGPLGAKGVGEVPVLPTAPAVLNAVENAIGVVPDLIPFNAADLKSFLGKKPL